VSTRNFLLRFNQRLVFGGSKSSALASIVYDPVHNTRYTPVGIIHWFAGRWTFVRCSLLPMLSLLF
jgi:hypothetical protein